MSKPKFTWQQWVDTLREVKRECLRLAKHNGSYCFSDAWLEVRGNFWGVECKSREWEEGKSGYYFRHAKNRTPKNINYIFDSSIEWAIQEAKKMGVIVK